MRAVSDTGPLHYLVLLEHVDMLQVLFGEITVPEPVRDELTHPSAPDAVRHWMTAPPT